MTLVRDDEATTMHCPFARHEESNRFDGGGLSACVGNRCMAWRYAIYFDVK